MVSREDGGMNALSRGLGRGGTLVPADSLLWPEKVPPAVVGFHPSYHPVHWEGVLPSGVGLGENRPLVPFQGSHRGSIVARYHPTASQEGGAGDYKTDSFGLVEME